MDKRSQTSRRTTVRRWIGLACAVAVLTACAPDAPGPPAAPGAAPSLPSAGSMPELPAELRQLMGVKDTAAQLSQVLGEDCLGGGQVTNKIYHVEISSPQVQSVRTYGSSSNTGAPFQENFQRIADIITSGNGQFSQTEAQQICDELNAVVDEIDAMVSEATSGPGPGGPGPGGPGPGGPGPGGPGPGGPGPPGRR